MSKLFKIIIWFCALLICVSIGYYFMIFLPQKQQTREQEAKNTFIFQKNKECFDYKEDTLKKYEYDMMDIFYSPTLNTCIFAYWDYRASEDGTHYNTIHMIKDLFSNKIIFEKTDSPAWEEEINELKK